MVTNNQTNLHNSSRRGKKQKQQTTTISTKEGDLIINAKYKKEAIATIRKLDRAKRRVSLFNKIAVLVAFVCVGNNAYTILNNRHRKKYGVNGGFLIVMSEAFQSINLLQRSNIKEWSLFGSSTATAKYIIPRDTLQGFGSYPNLLNITDTMRSEYHPIVKLPIRKMKKGDVISENGGTCVEQGADQTNKKFWPFNRKKNNQQSSSCIPSNPKMIETYDYIVQDFTQKKEENKVSLEGGKKVPQLLSSKEEAIEYAKHQKAPKRYDVGRFDEDRRGMYTSDLFGSGDDDESSSRRTVHVGLDIGAPVNTNVYSFTEGKIHSVGYNSDLGDYGHVIVIAHTLQNGKIVYALYGHLSKKSITGKFVGQAIKRGQLIGSLGNTAENGGWTGMFYLRICLCLILIPPSNISDFSFKDHMSIFSWQ